MMLYILRGSNMLFQTEEIINFNIDGVSLSSIDYWSQEARKATITTFYTKDLKNILEGAGFEVTTAVDGLDAFTKLKVLPIDLVVSDVDMPRMNGFILTEKIRSEKKISDIPVILVTSLDSKEDREHGITVGADAYIVKSGFDQGNLLEVISRLIGAARC